MEPGGRAEGRDVRAEAAGRALQILTDALAAVEPNPDVVRARIEFMADLSADLPDDVLDDHLARWVSDALQA